MAVQLREPTPITVQREPQGAPLADVADAIAMLDEAGKKNGELQKALDYFEGRQEVDYISQAMRQLKDKRPRGNYDHVHNWCEPIVSDRFDRINIVRIEVEGGTRQAELNTWFQQVVKLEAQDAHRFALVYGGSYMIVGDDENGEPEAYYSDPRYTVILYDPNNPRKKRLAAIWWDGTDGEVQGRRLTLYYRDRIVRLFAPGRRDITLGADGRLRNLAGRFVSQNVLHSEYLNSANYQEIESEPARIGNRMGEIPVVFMPTSRPARPEFYSVLSHQNRINMLSMGKMLALEYGILPINFLLTAAEIKEGDIQMGPNTINQNEDATARVVTIDPPKIDLIDAAIDKEERRIIEFKNLATNRDAGANTSGEALRVRENGKIARIKDIHLYLGFAWQEINRLWFKLVGGDNPPIATVVWESPETSILAQEIELYEALILSKVPVPIAGRMVWDWDPELVSEIERGIAREQDAAAARMPQLPPQTQQQQEEDTE